jgi:hypothetical protein
VTGLAGGSVIEGFDGDLDLDLMCSSWRLEDPLRYFENDAAAASSTAARAPACGASSAGST